MTAEEMAAVRAERERAASLAAEIGEAMHDAPGVDPQGDSSDQAAEQILKAILSDRQPQHPLAYWLRYYGIAQKSVPQPGAEADNIL